MDTALFDLLALLTLKQALGQKLFSQMNSSMVIKIGIVATVTVGGMAALSHPCDRGIRTSMYSRCRRRALRDASCEIKGWRVTGETMTIHPTHLTTNLSKFGAKVS